MIMKISLKCNFTVHKNSSVNYARSLKRRVQINERWTLVMIDSKISENFISRKFGDKQHLKIRRKKNSYDLMILNENSLFSDDKNVNTKITFVILMMNTYKKKIIIDVIWMISHDIVLNIFWLRHHNSVINWTKKILKNQLNSKNVIAW